MFVFPPVSLIDLEARWKAFKEFAEPILGVALADFSTDSPTKPLAALFAGDELLWLDGDDQTGRSFMVAIRAAVVLARERCESIADAESFLQEKVDSRGRLLVATINSPPELEVALRQSLKFRQR